MSPAITGQPVYRFYQLAWSGLDWLYPPICGGCGKPGSRWCQDCQHQTQVIPDTICQQCGDILPVAGLCDNCRDRPPAYLALRSWAAFTGPLHQALVRLKYHGDLSLGEILARPLINLLGDMAWPVDLVVAVPTGTERKKERGYNQAALLALPLALGSGIPYCSKGLIKIRETRTQVGLNVQQRHENVSGVFQAKSHLVNEKCVLVVDDVTTSGATMQACSQALLESGARSVYGLTLARAVRC